jgi:hypothetical protein
MMTGRVLLEPKKAYLSFVGSGFSSSFGEAMREGTGGMPDVRCKDSFGTLQGGKSIAAAMSSKELTSSTYCSVLKSSISK